MILLDVNQISKRFGQMQAVKDVSFEVESGEIFGLLGPNGAGKTTTIRMALDIIRPDSGSIAIFGGEMDEEKKNRIGYLPEERGLYADVKLEKALSYLASLKGVNKNEIESRSTTYLKKLDLWDHRHKKLRELSRGMHQKAQFIATVLHDPELLIVDEPFSGLDPVNTEIIKGMLLDLKQEGKAIIMCTHQMHQVEAMCDRIALIHEGGVALAGEVGEVRRRFAGNSVEVRANGPIDQIPGIAQIKRVNGELHLQLDPDISPQSLLKEMALRPDIDVEHFAVTLPGLNEIFIQTTRGQDG